MRKDLNDINSYLRIEKKKAIQNTKQWSVSQHFLFELTSISHDYDCFLWVWNLVVDTAGGKEAEGVKENIWTEEGQGNGGMEETA